MPGANRTLGAPPAATEAPAGPSLDVGAVLGAYRLTKLLGEGGMGRVFLAEHEKLGRMAAIKLLRAEYAYQPEAVQRFFGEARVVNQINHEHVVEIIDFVDGPGAEKYYVMELLRGQSLRQVLDSEGAMPVPRAIAIAEQICDTLAAVHAANVVHRDLKPDNVFLIERGGQPDFVKLLDFGVAKLIDDKQKRANQTAAGGLLGTPEYMAPEQLSGKPVDGRTDIYALGVMLFEIFTGKKPFAADSFGEIVVMHLTQAPPSLNADVSHPLPQALDDVVLSCLQKTPADRPSSMLELRRRLTDAASGAPGRATSTRRKRNFALPAIAFFALAAGAGGFWWVTQAREAPPVIAPSEVAPMAATPPASMPATVAATPPPAVVKAESVTEKADAPKTEIKKKRKRRIDRGGLVDPYSQ